MKHATWNVWLINKGEEPFLYADNLPNGEPAAMWCVVAARKVFDGSDADAFIMTRSDYYPTVTLTKVQ
jgi:hypothetical protein